MSRKPRRHCVSPRPAWMRVRARSWTCSMPKYNCSLRNPRAYKHYSDTIRRWQNSIERPARGVCITRCSRISLPTLRKPKPTTPAAALTPRENRNKSRRPRCELRSEGPGLRIRSKSQVPNFKPQVILKSQVSKLVLHVDCCRQAIRLLKRSRF